MRTLRSRFSFHTSSTMRKFARRLLRRPSGGADAAMTEFVRSSDVFDAAWYVREYPDVARSGMDPAVHYAKYGAMEGRCASKWFDSHHYLQTNRDVAAAGVNPLVHFCQHGRRELRSPSADFDAAWYWLTKLAETDPSADPLAHCRARGDDAKQDVRAPGKLSSADRMRARAIASQLISRKDHDVALVTRLANACMRLDLHDEIEKALQILARLCPSDIKVHLRLAQMFSLRKKWWQAVEAWTKLTTLDDTQAEWFYQLAVAQERMNRHDSAAAAYAHAIKCAPDHPWWHYRRGFMLEMAGRKDAAEAAYREAIERDDREEVARFGIGVFHQARGYWPEAADAYAARLKNDPADAELHYRLGMAHDRCYRWKDAEKQYQQAISLQIDAPHWHYRYGFVLERQKRYGEAAQAYAAAAMFADKHMPCWWYRRGYVFAAQGRWEEACNAYLGMNEHPSLAGSRGASDDASDWVRDYVTSFASEDFLADALIRDTTDARVWFHLGGVRELAGNWTGAADAYRAALARSNEHRGEWYYRLGFVLSKARQYAEASVAFGQTRIQQRAFGVKPEEYRGNVEQQVLVDYNEYLETLAVRRRCVLYESMLGSSVGGNPYAIFLSILDHPDYADWTHVWVLSKDVEPPEAFRRRTNVIFVERQSDLYRRYLATASHLVSDVTFPYWFIRRPEQKFLNTWHGTPLKKLGKDIPGEFLKHGNVQRNLLQVTHLISPNRHTSDALMDGYDVRGLFGGKLAETGYPRIDRMLRATGEQRDAIRRRLHLRGDAPVLLYAPTWRGEHGHAQFDVGQLREDIGKLADLPCQVVFRGHHMVEKMLRELDLPVVIARQDLDTSDVLAVTDVLVTDYSSIFFDFLPAKRPIFHYCHDWKEYSEQRGLYFDIDALPGHVCKDMSSLIDGLSKQFASGHVAPVEYAEAVARFSPHEDGSACRRVVDFFFNNDDEHVVDRYGDARRSLLFFAGHFTPNGITSSFLNLANGLVDLGHDRLSVMVDGDRINANPSWKDKFEELPSRVASLSRVGRMVNNPEEYWVSRQFVARRGLPAEEMWEVLCGAYRRELTRLVGSARVDAFINFEGYSEFWTSVIGMGATASGTNVSYLHNDMIEEYRIRHPYMGTLFGTYPYYDGLISVSEHMCEINRGKMSAQLGLSPTLFRSCINTINVAEIRRRASESLDPELENFLKADTCFLTMGRMSPEKDHAKLLEAFAQVHASHSETSLIVLGDGPLREKLHTKVRDLGIGDAVLLAGQRRNPFPALARCDCFVLPSNHEGQPMVLLEAMVLGRPIVATDIDGNRGVLKNGYGMLVDNSVQGVRRGLESFISGDTNCRRFDAEAYTDEALRAFRAMLDRVGGAKGKMPLAGISPTSVKVTHDEKG